MDRTYEVMFIVRPDMVEEELDKLISNLEAAVTGGKGTVKSIL
jgi:small subunit ribosomal protein S6